MARTSKASKATSEAPNTAATTSGDQQTSATKENAKWTLEDERTFIGYLADHVAERGDGNYKMTTFNAAATFLEERRTAGGPKTGASCKNKWARIKETYTVCYKLKHNQGTSGFTWSEEKGADIGIEDEAVWEAYVKKNPKADQFKSKGWPLYEAVDKIIPDKVKGKNLFAASQAPAPNPQSPGDPEGAASDTEDSEEPSSQEPSTRSVSYAPPPSPPAPSSGRKRSALEADGSTSISLTSTTTPRLPRDTAVSRSIDRMSEVLAVFAAPATPAASAVDTALESTPKRRRIAVELAAKQEDDELSDDDMVELIEVMRRDITAADTYLSLSKTSTRLRRAWVRRVVDQRYS